MSLKICLLWLWIFLLCLSYLGCSSAEPSFTRNKSNLILENPKQQNYIKKESKNDSNVLKNTNTSTQKAEQIKNEANVPHIRAGSQIQAPEEKKTVPISSPILCPGDIIRLEIVGEKENSGEFMILADGTITHPLIKEFKVRGKTQEKVRQELIEKFSSYLVDPVVNLSIIWGERKVYVSGTRKGLEAVTLPGNETITASRLIMTVNLPESADISEFAVVRKRPGEKEIKMLVPLEEILKTNDIEKDVVLEPNDLIVIEKTRQVFIHGNVLRPGSFYIQKNQKMSLWELLSLTQGPTNNADLDHIKILRKNEKGETEVNNVSLSLEDGSLLLVQPDDIVLIPSLSETNMVTIYGEVRKPGTFNIGKETRISSLLALAGGLTEYASNWIQILRYLPNGQAQKFSVHFKSILDGDREHDILLQPKDVIYIGSSIW